MARMIELTTPLGADTLLFRALRGKDELSRLSEFELSALSLRADIGPGDLLGKNVTITVELRDGGSRYFDLYVTRFSQGGMVGRYHEYRLTLRPWLWFLTRTSDCRIFQDKTVPDIVKEVFADHSVAVFEDSLTAAYPKREYCVQYRETDFDFVNRLLEEEVVPTFYDRNARGIPVRWVTMIKQAIATVTPRFSARRMLKEYVTRAYAPAFETVVKG